MNYAFGLDITIYDPVNSFVLLMKYIHILLFISFLISLIFEKYLNDSRLNEIQKQFVKKLMEYLIKNGVLDYAELCEETFFDLGESVADIFDGNIKIFREIQKDINEINKNGGKNL